MNIVSPYQSITSSVLVGLKQLVVAYVKSFPGLYPHNVKIGVFPSSQRYPAVSVNPRLSKFDGYLSGRRYYVTRSFDVNFFVDDLTKNHDRVLFEYAHSLVEILRDREEFVIKDKRGRKQTINFEVGNVSVSRGEILGLNKRGSRIEVPLSFVSKNEIQYPDVASRKDIPESWASEEEIALGIFKRLLAYKHSNLRAVREFVRTKEAPTLPGNTVIMKIDNSLLEHFEVGVDVANLALNIEVWSRLTAAEDKICENLDIADEIVELMFIDPYVSGYAYDSFWEVTNYRIDTNEQKTPFFVSSIIWMIRVADEVQRIGV